MYRYSCTELKYKGSEAKSLLDHTNLGTQGKTVKKRKKKLLFNPKKPKKIKDKKKKSRRTKY